MKYRYFIVALMISSLIAMDDCPVCPESHKRVVTDSTIAFFSAGSLAAAWLQFPYHKGIKKVVLQSVVAVCAATTAGNTVGRISLYYTPEYKRYRAQGLVAAFRASSLYKNMTKKVYSCDGLSYVERNIVINNLQGQETALTQAIYLTQSALMSSYMPESFKETCAQQRNETALLMSEVQKLQDQLDQCSFSHVPYSDRKKRQYEQRNEDMLEIGSSLK